MRSPQNQRPPRIERPRVHRVEYVPSEIAGEEVVHGFTGDVLRIYSGTLGQNRPEPPELYKEGDRVLVLGGHADKGPFVVEKVLGGGKYELRDGGTKKIYEERDLQLTYRSQPRQAPPQKEEEEKKKKELGWGPSEETLVDFDDGHI